MGVTAVAEGDSIWSSLLELMVEISFLRNMGHHVQGQSSAKLIIGRSAFSMSCTMFANFFQEVPEYALVINHTDGIRHAAQWERFPLGVCWFSRPTFTPEFINASIVYKEKSNLQTTWRPERRMGVNFSVIETQLLLDGVRLNYQCLFGTLSGSGQAPYHNTASECNWQLPT